jgi:hypothetical protein
MAVGSRSISRGLVAGVSRCAPIPRGWCFEDDGTASQGRDVRLTVVDRMSRASGPLST